MAEQLDKEELWGKVVYYDLRIADAERALNYAQEQRTYYIGLLAVSEAKNAS